MPFGVSGFSGLPPRTRTHVSGAEVRGYLCSFRLAPTLWPVIACIA